MATQRQQQYDENAKPKGSPQNPEKKLNGAGFMMILMLAGFKDFSDIFLNIGVISSILTVLTGLCISGIIWFYLFYSG